MVNKYLSKFTDKIKPLKNKTFNIFFSCLNKIKTSLKKNKFLLETFNSLKKFLSKTFFFLTPIANSLYKKIKTKFQENPELKKRTIYGLIFAVFFLFVLICGNLLYMIFIFSIFCIMSYELLKMVSKIEQSNNKMFVRLRGFGLIYIAICCLGFILIRESTQGLRVSFWMFLTVWSVDVFAYIFGKKFGKIKLAPEISPNKTYEGAIFGTIGGSFVSIGLYKLLVLNGQNSLSIVSFFILSLIIIILAQLGDLSESYIKRQCGVKDSGSIIPGHGGLFDRFDSFLLVSPFIFIVVWLNDWVLF